MGSLVCTHKQYSNRGMMKAINGVSVAPSRLTRSAKNGTICARNHEKDTIRSTLAEASHRV